MILEIHPEHINQRVSVKTFCGGTGEMLWFVSCSEFSSKRPSDTIYTRSLPRIQHTRLMGLRLSFCTIKLQLCLSLSDHTHAHTHTLTHTHTHAHTRTNTHKHAHTHTHTHIWVWVCVVFVCIFLSETGFKFEMQSASSRSEQLRAV